MGHNFLFKMSLVKVKNLTISFKQYDNIVHAVRGISFEINQGESLGIVGESGSGKSVTFMTVMGLMNSPTSIVEADLIEIDGINVLDKSKENIKKISAEGISGTNSVKVILDGQGDMQKIEISDEILKEKKSIVEDLIVAAHNNAKVKLKAKTSEEISKATGGFGIPGFKWPI